jgi:hypothetical protein
MLVTYVDDAFMHLVLFWLILLPIGRTLNLYDWLRGSPAFEAWAGVTVPGGTTRLFLINLGIAYFVAGVYKWTSPMWRNGSALYAILKLPIAFSPHHLKPRHLPLLRIINYAALAIEPFFPLVFVLPPSSVTKWVVLAGLVGFHLGIVATLKIPFANLAMLGAIPIVLHDEIMIGLLGRPSPLRNTALGGIGLAELVGLALVSGISLMLFLEIRFVGRLTSMKGRRNSICMALWWVGIAQSYRLFDWIDLRNSHVRYEVFESVLAGSSHAIDPAGVFPRSIRHLLLQSYLHGNVWVQIDPPGLRELRRAILERYAHRYARRRGNTGTIEVFAIRQRITSDNLALERGVRRPLLRFYCAGGEPVFEYLCVNPEDEYFGAPGVVELEPVATINPPCEVRECAGA